MNQYPSLHSSARHGYGLVVIAALFTAFALIAAVTLDRNSSITAINQQRAAEAQLSRLSLALAKFAKYNSDRFPCPASMLLVPSDSNFGSPAGPTCYTGTPDLATPPATGTRFVTSYASSDKLIMGMVPVKVLVPYGVSYNDAFDPWGNRIAYVVHRDLTVGRATLPTITDAERPEVHDYLTGENVGPYPDMVLISYGRDRIGATLRSATTPAFTFCSNADDLRYANCDGDNLYFTGPLNTQTSTAASYFDDTVSTYRYGAGLTNGGTGCAADAAYSWNGNNTPNSLRATACTASLPALADGATANLTHCTAGGTGKIGFKSVTCFNGTLSSASGSRGDCRKANCFVGETMILLADGRSVPISELKVGDKVRGKDGINTVLSIPTVTDDRPLYGFNGGSKMVTAGHPFYTAEGWKSIDPRQTPDEGHAIAVTQLEVGDRLLRSDGSDYSITSIDKAELGEHTLYNPIMSGDHTYYANGLLVHNKIGVVAC